MRAFASRAYQQWSGLWAHALVGALAGALFLHPITKAIYGGEWRGAVSELKRLAFAFTPGMLPMTGAFALLGAVVGVVFGFYHRLLAQQDRVLGFLEAELARTVSSLIGAGESEHVEFKAAARWDRERGCVSREMEAPIVRTIAGFLNNSGGSLLIGVTDDRAVCGIERDYGTLRDGNRNGFERFIIGLVRSRIGGEACPLVHVTFHRTEDRDICRVIVEPAARPAYVHDGGTSRLFVRAGNSTRELDVREAMEHVTQRFAKGRSGRIRTPTARSSR